MTIVSTDIGAKATGNGWLALRRGGESLPPSVRDRLDWYARNARYQRKAFYVAEVALIVLSAAIPAVTALHAPAATAAVLGSAVVVVGAVRHVWRWGENWIRSSRALLDLQAEVVKWSTGVDPYQTGDATATLVARTEAIVAGETAGWAQALQSAHGPAATPPPPATAV